MGFRDTFQIHHIFSNIHHFVFTKYFRGSAPLTFTSVRTWHVRLLCSSGCPLCQDEKTIYSCFLLSKVKHYHSRPSSLVLVRLFERDGRPSVFAFHYPFSGAQRPLCPSGGSRFNACPPVQWRRAIYDLRFTIFTAMLFAHCCLEPFFPPVSSCHKDCRREL
jgi:hypothetical protein